MNRERLRRHQLSRLNQLLAAILPRNVFYARKLTGVRCPLASWDRLAELPLTTKEELLEAGERFPPANLTYDLAAYTRVHCTSGTHSRPLYVYDTDEDWRWWIETWQYVLDAADVTGEDRALMAFSFGPFIGFWSAAAALSQRGALVIPTGGMNTAARLDILEACRATVVCCTPTYALRMSEVASQQRRRLQDGSVRTLIVAGEPGGSLPSVRSRIQQAWGAGVIDHGGATEVGPWGYGDSSGAGLHIVESEFIAEFLPPSDGHDGPHELVLTALGRYGWPVIRYRTGDLVRPVWERHAENSFVWLEGGIVGRADEMLVVRGVNVYPSAIEEMLRSFPDIDEFRITVYREGELDQLKLEVEDRRNDPERIVARFQTQLGLRVIVECVPPGSLPRFEAKSRRLIDRRTAS
jgi:phenylacetate-CoA ligase